MIFKTASPISPDVYITIDSVPTNYMALQRISLEEHENTHTLAVLDFTGLSPSVVTEYIDKPIQIKIEFPNASTTEFVGYIPYVEPMSVTKDGLIDGSPLQITRLYCLGAGYAMKSKRSDAWEDVTIVDIAKKMADRYRFSTSVPDDTYRFPRLVQAAISDWELLVMACTTLGYSVAMRGTHLHIWDPFKAMSHMVSYATLKTIKGNGGNVTPNIGQVLSFDGRIGAVTPTASRTSNIINVLDKHGKVFSISDKLTSETSGLGNPLQSVFTNTMAINADSFETGYRLVTGELRRGYSISASVDITGTPSITSGGIVKLDKYDSRFDGFWYVKSVRHTITKTEMMSNLELGRDSLDTVDDVSTSTEAYVQPPASSLIGGVWVSSKDLKHVYK